MIDRTVRLDVAGLGLMLYSPWALVHVAEGADYFASNFASDEDVAEHVRACAVAAFCTGSPGTYVVRCTTDVVSAETPFDASVRLGLEVRDRAVCVRDVYDLMEWTAECPGEQRLELEDGFFWLMVSTRRPPSGITGDLQEIVVTFERSATRPYVACAGVPELMT